MTTSSKNTRALAAKNTMLTGVISKSSCFTACTHSFEITSFCRRQWIILKMGLCFIHLWI